MTENGRRLVAVLDEALDRLALLVAVGDLETFRQEAPRWEGLVREAGERLRRTA